MKIINALKKVKHLDRKIEKNEKRVSRWCSYVVENDKDPAPTYDAEGIRRLIQQANDWLAEKAKIQHALHHTNIEVKTTLRGTEYSIDELLGMRNVIIPRQIRIMKTMRRAEKGGSIYDRGQKTDSHVVLQYDPRERDKQVESLENLQNEIDEALDILNIETEVIGVE